MGMGRVYRETSSPSAFKGLANSTNTSPAITTSTAVTETVNGSHQFKITGYTLSKGIGIGKYVASDTFTVGGYSWAIYFYPDGKSVEDNAEYVSLFIALASEGTDVRALFELTLLDQSGKERHKVHSHFGRPLEGGPYSLKYRGSMWSYTEGPKIYSIPVPPSDIGQHFGKLLESGKGTDVNFEVDREIFNAHKVVLAARSPVFRAQLFGPMKDNNTQCINVEDMEAPVFKALLHFIYCDALPNMEELTGSNLKWAFTLMSQHLLAAADRYGLERLRLLCEANLCEDVAINTVATTLALAEQHRCSHLKSVCLKFVAMPENLRAVMQTDGFEYLKESCPSVLTELLQHVARISEHSAIGSSHGNEAFLDGSDVNVILDLLPILGLIFKNTNLLCVSSSGFVWFQLFFSYFKDLVGREVTVELKNDLAIRGTLHSVDQYLNIKLENTRVVDQDKYPHMALWEYGLIDQDFIGAFLVHDLQGLLQCWDSMAVGEELFYQRICGETCVLKVDLGCCKACVVRLKKLLSTIDGSVPTISLNISFDIGVYGYDIDSEKGLVTVLGRAHPQLLVEKIRQKKKKAVVVSYEKPAPDAKTKDSNNTKEDKKNGDLDSKPKEHKKKHSNGDQKGFKKEDIFGHHESDPHEFEAYVPPKPSALDTCRDPYCKLHHKKPVIIRPSDNVPKVMLQPPLNHPRFLPPPPRFRPPPPGPHYPRSYREEYLEDHRYRLPHVPHVEPIVYDRPLPQYDPWYNQRPPPQHDPWCYQRPAPPLPPHYGYHGAKQAYIGHY
ncbi:hypothetical protein RHSIM_Rhsim01G0276800 [Rhododendron simsii]|uniref:Uncharacterized protein n=1 Tax=Rhododendron simsii TaxID=118357 RepID=A0A834M179_RHOSS|nr:hypothetical protein RHSIM_Rhsim01G0276800 [Rhododendron simsii]